VRGTVGLWSKDPLREVRTVDLKPREVGEGWSRGLRAVATTSVGYVTVYVAHLPSVRASWPQGLKTGWRNESAGLLGAALQAEQGERVLLLGDLNASADDRGLDPVLAQMDDSGGGFGFSWPERFPVGRGDHGLRTAGAHRERPCAGDGAAEVLRGAGLGLAIGICERSRWLRSPLILFRYFSGSLPPRTFRAEHHSPGRTPCPPTSAVAAFSP
jgi:vancomycin resistance protein VanJ